MLFTVMRKIIVVVLLVAILVQIIVAQPKGGIWDVIDKAFENTKQGLKKAIGYVVILSILVLVALFLLFKFEIITIREHASRRLERVILFAVIVMVALYFIGYFAENIPSSPEYNLWLKKGLTFIKDAVNAALGLPF